MVNDPNLEHKKKTQANFYIHELSKLTQERDLFLSLLAQKQAKNTEVFEKGKSVAKSGKSISKSVKSQSSIINTYLIGKRSHSMTLPFLITFEISNIK
jgi:hypothetical protein